MQFTVFDFHDFTRKHIFFGNRVLLMLLPSFIHFILLLFLLVLGENNTIDGINTRYGNVVCVCARVCVCACVHVCVHALTPVNVANGLQGFNASVRKI